jgi:hypothetical protein
MYLMPLAAPQVRTLQVFRMLELLAPWFQSCPGVRDIVAGRLRTELS